MTSTSKTGASRSRQREFSECSPGRTTSPNATPFSSLFLPLPLRAETRSVCKAHREMTTERSPTKILHQTRRIYRICGGGGSKGQLSLRIVAKFRWKREKERDKEREEFTLLGVEGENGSNVRSRVKKGHGRWRKGLVNIDQSCSGTIELTIPLKSLVERGQPERICPSLSTNPFLDSGGRERERISFTISCVCTLYIHDIFGETFFFFFFLKRFRANKNASEREGGVERKQLKFSIFFAKQSHKMLLPQAPPTRRVTRSMCRWSFIYLFIYLFFPSPPFSCVVTACAKKKEKKRNNLRYDRAFFSTR